MGYKQSAYQSLRQEMRLSPYLLQFLGIIQLPLIDLQAKVMDELELNPVLEAEGLFQFEESEVFDNTGQDEDVFFPSIEEDLPRRQGAGENLLVQIKAPHNWRAELLSKLSAVIVSSQEREFCEYLINNVDSTGLLTVSFLDAAAVFNTGIERAQILLKAIQDAGPAGLCARDVREAILLRIEREEGRSVLFSIVKDFLPDAINKRYGKIAKALNISRQDVVEQLSRLKEFQPTVIEDESVNEYVFPEVEVRVENGQLFVLENTRFIPKLRINKAYLELAKKSRDKKAEEFVAEHINRAKALLSAIEERQKRLVSLVRFLAEKQRGFVEEGYSRLLPLTLKEAARYLDVSESTVSRLSNRKYVQLPWGIVRIKDFFSNPLSHKSETGPETTKALIKEILLNSTGRRPSDNAIAKRLKEMGIEISRRTVNKYRRQIKL